MIPLDSSDPLFSSPSQNQPLLVTHGGIVPSSVDYVSDWLVVEITKVARVCSASRLFPAFIWPPQQAIEFRVFTSDSVLTTSSTGETMCMGGRLSDVVVVVVGEVLTVVVVEATRVVLVVVETTGLILR